MRVGANTLKYLHIPNPMERGLPAWVKKTFTKEHEADAALIVFCLFLVGFLFFSLLKAFSNYHIIA